MCQSTPAALKGLLVQDQAKADALEAEKTGSTADARSSALNPLLALLPVGCARARLVLSM